MADLLHLGELAIGVRVSLQDGLRQEYELLCILDEALVKHLSPLDDLWQDHVLADDLLLLKLTIDTLTNECPFARRTSRHLTGLKVRAYL